MHWCVTLNDSTTYIGTHGDVIFGHYSHKTFNSLNMLDAANAFSPTVTILPPMYVIETMIKYFHRYIAHGRTSFIGSAEAC